MATQLLEFTDYTSPDGESYRFETYDKFILSEQGLGMPEIEYITQRGPFQHGQTMIDYRFKPRIVQMVHRRNSCSRSQYWANRTELLNIINPARQLSGYFSPGVLRKTLPDGSVRCLDVYLERGPVFEAREQDRWDEWAFTETLRFIAPDPTFYDPTEVSISFTQTSSAYTHTEIPMPVPTKIGSSRFTHSNSPAYSGTSVVFPHSIVIEGPISSPVIRNTTTGEKLDFLGLDLTSSQSIVINLSYGVKSVVNENGVSLIGSLTVDSDLATFHIAPDPEAAGGVNVITTAGLGSTSSTSLVIKYYNRYIGI